jgi:predicted Zn-dependent protease
MAIEGLTNTTTTTTTQCPPGQQLVNGVCVTAMAETPTTASEAYSGLATGLQQTTAANIDAARQTTAQQQQVLQSQLEQQRQDYLKNRQTLQKETFLRGRNVLANLANRGLATSGLQQLGDVQRTIATGQQMNELSQAFERAREGLTTQQTQLATGLQQYEAGQQAGLANQLASTQVQAQQAATTEAERSVAYAESLASIMADPTISQAQKDALAPLYERLITTTPTTTTTATEGITATEGTPTPSLADLLGTTTTPPTRDELITSISNYTGSLSGLEERALSNVLKDSENLQQDSPFLVALSSKPEGLEITPSVTTENNKAGLNDNYSVTIDGTQYDLEGRELAVLIMNGKVKVPDNIAVSIMQRVGGGIATTGTIWGNKYDAISKPYLKYLEEAGLVKRVQGGNYIITATDLIR